MFKVSVIIPVYNAEKYLRKAVESSVDLDEVGEVILVEDRSPDNALDVAFFLQKEYHKVKVFQHPDKQNHGAGASRNLGIENAQYDYIAFLDADDYYLPNRFKKDKIILQSNPSLDGVYGALGIHYYSNKAKKTFLEAGFGYQEFLTISQAVEPEDLFTVLFHAKKSIQGEFHTNTVTLHKRVFDRVGFFNTSLRLRQDIHLWRRLAAFCKLAAGEIENPIAIRGVHEGNRMTNKNNQKKYMDFWWYSLKKEFKDKKLEKTKYKIFEQAYFNYMASHQNKTKAIISFFKNLIKYPSIIKYSYGNFDFNFWKVFGKNKITLHFISFKNRFIFKNT